MQRVDVATQSHRVPVLGNSRSSRTGGVVCRDEYNNRCISALEMKDFNPRSPLRAHGLLPHHRRRPYPPAGSCKGQGSVPLEPTGDTTAPTQAVVVVAPTALDL